MSRRKPDPTTGQPQLTYRERIFINEYIKNGGNGKEAAIAAGYGAARADQSAYQVLHRIQVQQQIQDRISESDVCSGEVIGTLASFMRGNIAELLDDDGNFDLALVKEKRLGHLLKTVTRTTREIITEPGRPPQLVEDYRIQLHSPVQAASILARLMGLNRRASDFLSSDIADNDPSSLPNDLPNDLPDDRPDNLDDALPDDLPANNQSEPHEPGSRHGIDAILDPAFWMERLINLEMERQGRSRSEVIQTLIQLRPDSAEFIRPEPLTSDDSSATSRETPLFTNNAAHEIGHSGHDPEIVDDPEQTARSRVVGSQTSSAEHLKRTGRIVENLKKLNTTQCLERDSARCPNTSTDTMPGFRPRRRDELDDFIGHQPQGPGETCEFSPGDED